MEIRKFRKEYDLELIPTSHEGILPGDLVWDPILGPPSFSRKGMPNTIYTAFLDAGLVSENDWEEFRKENQETPLANAHFATRNVDVSVEFIQELQHPKIGRISGEFRTEKISKFTFGDLQMRKMSDLMRIKIDQFLEQMRASRWREYDGSIRRVFLITELYYGTIHMVIEKQFRTELEASMKKADLIASGKSEGSHAVEYEFSHDNVPFAMRIERVRKFNG
ncbi:MAG: hypothetical protein P1P86_00635 [Bacteroidales bacterium]|nr:hypothetical protein [Bacteroidales bacterium]